MFIKRVTKTIKLSRKIFVIISDYVSDVQVCIKELFSLMIVNNILMNETNMIYQTLVMH